MIPRISHTEQALDRLTRYPVVAILGARQVGKTTLAGLIADRFDGPTARFDLEDPDDLARLDEPNLALGPLEGLVIIDEVQRRPDLFPILRVLADRHERQTRFLILGSASPDLLRQTSESLAGRITYCELGGFALDEVGWGASDRLWSRGGFPRSYLARSERASFEWRRDFIRTFLERDIPSLGVQIPSTTLHRFWQMLAHYHGQLWNGAELARAFGVSSMTVRRYLDLLTGALVIRQLPPWFENIAKRQVKSPKVYIADTGILHTLLVLKDREDIEGHPKVGASWEGFVIREIMRLLDAQPEEVFFWAAHSGAELDLLLVRGMKRFGFEIKRTTSPSTSRSMHAAIDSLNLDRLDLIHAGDSTFQLRENIRAVSFYRLEEDLEHF